MALATILLAEDEEDFLTSRAELLRRSGYSVITASSPSAAIRILETAAVDVAVLDLRLKGGGEEDKSGLDIAKEIAPSVPKIILSAHRDFEALLEARSTGLTGVSPVVTWIDKAKDTEQLIEAIEMARSFIPLYRMSAREPNQDLHIELRGVLSIREWARRITGALLSDVALNAQAEEIEWLIRKLFSDFRHVQLDDIPTGRIDEARAWVTSTSGRPGRFLLKVWPESTMWSEKANWDDRLRKTVSDAQILRPMDWLHHGRFGGAIFAGLDPQREPFQWLTEYVHWYDSKEVSAALDSLFDMAQKNLYVVDCEPVDTESLDVAYRRLVGLDRVRREEFQRATSDAIETLDRQYVVKSQRVSDNIIFVDRRGAMFEGVDPSELVFGDQPVVGPPVLRRYCLGKMDGFNALVDRKGDVLLTDFGEAGPAPALSDFVALEAKIRFDWFSPKEADSLLLLESALLPSDESPRKRERDLQKTLSLVRKVRSHAQQQVEADPIAYQLGLFYHAAQRVMTGEAREQRAQALLAASLLAKWLNGTRARNDLLGDA